MSAIVAEWAEVILRWSWQAALVLAVAWIVARRQTAPAVRYHDWLLAMVMVMLLPLCAAIVSWLPLEKSAPEPLTYVLDLPTAVGIASDFTNIEPSTSEAPTMPRSEMIRLGAFVAWTIGVLWNLTRLCGSWWRMHSIRRRAQTTRLEVLPDIPVELSADIASPVLAGIMRPSILLPRDITEWTTQTEQRAIVLHEVAHRTRRDPYAIVLQRIVETVFFFHPLVRYASRQLSLERELACDAEVLQAGADSASYAEAILKVAERGVQERHRLQPAFNASRKILERRMDMILNAGRRAVAPTLYHRAVLTAALTLITVICGFTTLQDSLTAAPEPLHFEPIVAPIAEPEVLVTPPPPVRRAPAVLQTQQPPVAPPQADPGTVTGKVTDASGAVVPGVTVRMRGSRTENVTTTNGVGSFTFSQVQPDTYRIEASLPGFQTQTLTFVLGAGGKFDGRLRLSLAPLNTAVEVVATRTSPIAGPAVTTAGPPPTGPIRIGGDVAMANLIQQVHPVYPAASRAAGVQGLVLIEATIDTSGNVVNPRVMSRIDAALTEAAVEAVKQWRYKPALLNGQPVEVVTTITVNFSLSD